MTRWRATRSLRPLGRARPSSPLRHLAGYAEEDAAQALDQFLNTQLGRNTRGDPVTRWATADGGTHVLALLLYDTLRRGGFDPAAGSYADFLARALSGGRPGPMISKPGISN